MTQNCSIGQGRKRTRGLAVLGIALAMVLAILTPRSWAQDNASISGTVTDASGAVVANAAVELTNTGTGVKREASANAVGAFHFGNIGAGTYTMTVAAAGFQKYTKTGIVVNVAANLDASVALAIGSESQTVSVQADALQFANSPPTAATLFSSRLSVSAFQTICLHSAVSTLLPLPTASASTASAQRTTFI